MIRFRTEKAVFFLLAENKLLHHVQQGGPFRFRQLLENV